ncbi:toll-like receptor Tollo [Varroa destructor]|uniref:TIR domain-containing protein n=1 Tax=Varroa destructor TaxID=109461 RepID=A0A7M7M5P8_VARDE|nr:toll-like receptor Tollo [Varroa destructor]
MKFSTISASISVLVCTLVIYFSRSCWAGGYVRPQDCTWEPTSDTSVVSMTCNVLTLRGGHDPTNFSLIMSDHTVKLVIRCIDPMLQSDMANNTFEHLNRLYSLRIERCKLDKIPSKAFQGLSDLEHLSVKTYNSDWGRRYPLLVSPASFTPLRSIQTLDLSYNNIERLPPGILCGLRHLQFANFTKNLFDEVLDMGFGPTAIAERCVTYVRELQVSSNRLRALPEKGFATLVHLEELRLDHNQLARMETTALWGLAKLERLDIANNMLVALPAALFQPTSKLSELYLRNNSLSALPPGLFTGLDELKLLDLAYNQLSALGWLGPEVSLSRLLVLDLSYNRLTRLDASSFQSLINLQTLQLHDNLIEFIADNTFSRLSNLQTLVLSNNRLQIIGPLMMQGLSLSIVALQLDHNRIKDIHIAAFKNVSMLQELNIASNRLTSVPAAVSSLNMLRSLDLADNEIREIANVSYHGLEQLYALNLMGNKIRNISQGAFTDLPSVRILNLASNDIRTIEQGTFDDVSGLHYLRLDSNAIEDVNGLFSNLHDLIMLNISVNRVRWFDYALIPVGLQWLDVHNNQIEALGNYFELEQGLKLRTLDASFNKLTDLDSSSLPNGIEIVFLKNNSLKRIQPFTFLGKQNLTRVDLSHNDLQTLDMTTFRLSEVPLRKPLPEFAIAGNPFECDCQMEWLQHLQNPAAMTSHNDSRQYPRVIDLYRVECKLSFSKNGQVLPLGKVKPEQFFCEYKSQCSSLCHCCHFDACDCETVCPDNCTCYHNKSWTTNIVDCSARNHKQIPKQLAIDATEIYVDGNDIAVVTPYMFAGRKNVKVLFLNNSNVMTIQNDTFASMQELRVLRLENNQISVLYGPEFNGLFKLQELYLSDNKLQHVRNITFTNLKSLRILHIDRNRLMEMSLWSLQHNPRLSDLRLADNPWTCSCPFTQDVAKFLHERGDSVKDIFQLSCAYNETSALPLWELNITQCRQSKATSLVQRLQFHSFGELLPLLTTLSILSIVLLVVVVTLFTNRHQISVWLFSRCGIRMFHRAPIEEEKLFDAFVSYSKKDEAFVAQILAPELECGNPPYRLCLHYRDLPMAGTYLSEAIQEAVESSRRTIVVLSEHFLKSEWCRYEFKSAHHEVLNNNHHKLVVIFLGKVSYRELDPDIRIWLKHSTFLHWGEKNFWDKVRYAMPPDAPRHRKVMRADLHTVAVHI